MCSHRWKLLPALAAVVALSAVARAEGSTVRTPRSGARVSPGVMASLSVGQQLTFGVGTDLRVLQVFYDAADCRFPSRIGAAGAFIQGTYLSPRAARFAGGLTAGGHLDNPWFGSLGEFGYTYRTRLGDDRAGHALHLGGMGMTLFSALDFSIRASVPFDGRSPEVTFGLGARVPIFDLSVGCSN